MSRALRRLSLGLFALLAMLASLSAQTNVKSGWGQVVLSDSVHPNKNVYDQVLMTGPNVTVGADADQMVRVSFLDDNEDITQVEFAGSGTVTIELDPATYQSPSAPRKYQQPGVNYVRGHATVRVRDAGPNTFISVFSVGRGNAVNQTLFPTGMTYDAMADLQMIHVTGAQAGGILTGNVRYSGRSGATGIHAPGTAVRYRVVVGEINASDDAVPLLRLGDGSALEWDAGAVLVAGGRLLQSNHTPLDVCSSSGAPLARVRAVDGTLSSGELRPAASIAAEFASRNSGSVVVDGTPRSTRGFIPVSFDELLGEAGFAAFDFGDGPTLRFSGGNVGTYTYAEDAWIEGELVHMELSGSYSYFVAGTNPNHMTFSLTFGTISFQSASITYRGTVRDIARLSGEVLPTRITAIADFTSSVSGSAISTVLFSNGTEESQRMEFDLEHELEFRFL